MENGGLGDESDGWRGGVDAPFRQSFFYSGLI
jgi:hypothetical protein